MPTPHAADSPSRPQASVVLVTGAAGGIGAAVVRALAGQGCDVVAVDVAEPGLGAFADQPRVRCRRLDVSDGDQVERVVHAVEAEIGPITGLVNAAGLLRPAPAVDLTGAAWAQTFAVNSTGVFHVSQAVGRRMALRGNGSIVTVASNAAAVPRAGMAAYAASKAAAVAFTRCLGLELAGSGVRCNIVSPGSTRTPMLTDLWQSGGGADATLIGDLAQFRTGIPLGRIAEPDDVAATVVYLLSDAARHVTLHNLVVDGGASLGVSA